MDDQLTPASNEFMQAAGARPDDQLPPAPLGDMTPASRQFMAAAGRPEWSDPKYSTGARLADIQRTHMAAGLSFDDAAPKIKEHLGLDPEQVKPAYRMSEERAKAASVGSLNPVTGQLDPGTLQNVLGALPVANTVQGWLQERDYGRAKDRLAKGEATDEDYTTIARKEREQQLQASQGTIPALTQAAGKLPAFVIEAGLGGAAWRGAKGLYRGVEGVQAAEAAAATRGGVNAALRGTGDVTAQTALTPALWAQQGAKNLNDAQDRDSFLQQSRSYGAAFTTGVIQNAILGRLTNAEKPTGTAVLGKLSQSLVGRTAGGILEQSTADMITGATGLSTGYGSLVDLAKGKYGDAGKELAVQTLTFGAFAMMHGGKKAGEEVLNKVVEPLKKKAEAGTPLSEAVESVKEMLSKVAEQYGLSGENVNKSHEQNIRDAADEAKYQETIGRARAGSGVYETGVQGKDLPEKPMIPEVLKAAGIDHKMDFHDPNFDIEGDKKGEVANLEYPEHYMALKYDPATKRIDMNFNTPEGKSDRLTAPIEQSGKVPAELFRDMIRIARVARDKGLGIQYDATADRHDSYSSMLRKNGFELKQTSGTGDTKSYVWEPKKGGNVSTPDWGKYREAIRSGLSPETARERAGMARDDTRTPPPEGGNVSTPDVPKKMGLDFDDLASKPPRERLNALEPHYLAAKGARNSAVAAKEAAQAKTELLYQRTPEGSAAKKQAQRELKDAKAAQRNASAIVNRIHAEMVKARDEIMSHPMLKGDSVERATAELEMQHKVGERPATKEDYDKAVNELNDQIETVKRLKDEFIKSGKSGGWSEASLQSSLDRVVQSTSKTAEAVAPGSTNAAEREVGAIQRSQAGDAVASKQAGERPNAERGANARGMSGKEAAEEQFIRNQPILTPEGAARTRGLTPGQLQDEAAQAAADDQLFGGPGRSTAMDSKLPPASFIAKFKGQAQAIWDGLKANVRGFRNNVDELSSVIAPRTARHSKAAADAIAARDGASVAIEYGTPYYLDKVATLKIGDEFPGMAGHKIADENQLTQANETLGAVFHEERLRHARMANAAESAKYANLAATMPEGSKERKAAEDERDYWHDEAVKVKSAIGTYELPNEERYQTLLNSDVYKKLAKDWEANMTPFMNEKFRSIRGLAEDDPVDRITQLPGRPFNAIAVREGDTAPGDMREMPATSRRGELRNPKINPYPYAKGFTGSAKGYVFDIRRIIENTVAKSTEAATKAEMYRVFESEGVGKWIAPGERVEINGKPAEVFKDVQPPRGTQAAEKGQIHFAVDQDAAKEFRKALDTDKPFLHIPGTGITAKLSLFSLVEAASHIKNLGTFAMKMPLKSIPDIFRVGFGVLRGNPDLQGRLRELAEMGAVKPQGPESGTLNLPGNLRYADPTYWTGKALDVVDTTMRLVADKAFDRIAASGINVDTSQFSRRNYINQLGQYLRRGQNDAIVFLRDTGLGPFATAGSNFTMQGLKSLLFSHGLQANDRVTDAKLRAFVALRLGVIAGGVGVLNQIISGRPDGDDKTPFGAIKVNDKDGKTGYIDVLGLTGWTRGARTAGLLALIEGARAKAPSGNVSTRAATDALHGLAHPAEGPLVSFAKGAMTGENTIGMPVKHEQKPGQQPSFLNAYGHTANNELLQNLYGALLNANPVLASLSGADRPNEKKKPGEAAGVSESTWRLLGPYGVKFRGSKPGQAYEKRTVVRPVGGQ